MKAALVRERRRGVIGDLQEIWIRRRSRSDSTAIYASKRSHGRRTLKPTCGGTFCGWWSAHQRRAFACWFYLYLGTDPSERKLAFLLIRTQANAGSGRIVPLWSLSPSMREALRLDAYLKAHLKDLGLTRDPRDYDLTVRAINLNQVRR
jgi:hypothetical protein